MKKRRQTRALLPALVLGGLMLVAALGASPAAAATESITKAAPANVTAGQNMAYTITVTNSSGVADTNVKVRDALSTDLNYVSDTAPGGCAGTPLICQLGNFAIGQVKSFVITVKVQPDTTGTIDNSADVIGDNTTQATSNTVHTTVDTSADLGVTKNCVPSTPIPSGSPGTCTITIHNNGPSDAATVVLTDIIGGSAVFNASASADGGGVCVFNPAVFPLNATQLTCTWASVPANGNVNVTVLFGDNGAAQPLTVSDQASVTTQTSDPNSNNNTASDEVNFAGLSADLSVTKSCKPESSKVPVGGTGTCFIEVHNLGPSDAHDVTLEDHIFSNGLFTVQTVTPGAPTCIPAAPVGPGLSITINCDLDTIAAGGVKTVKVEVTAVPGTDVNDHATVDSSTPDPDTGNNQADGTLSFAAISADLSVTKSCAPDPNPVIVQPIVVAGICEIVVHNGGPNTASLVHVVDQLFSNGPFRVHQISQVGPVPPGGNCVPAPALDTITQNYTVTCDAASLAAGADWVIDLSIQAISTLTVNDTVNVSSPTDLDTGNNGPVSAALNFLYSSDLGVSKLCKPDQNTLPAGNTGTCQILVRNNGPSDIRMQDTVTVTDHLVSDGLFTIPAGGITTIPGAICTPTPIGPVSNTTISCTFTGAVIPVGGFLEVDVKIQSAEGIDVNDTASFTSTVSDTNAANNTAQGGLSFTASADLAVRKTAVPDTPVVAGDEVTYTLTVFNFGPSTAKAVVVADTLPAGVTFDHVVAGFPTAGSVTPPPAGPGGTLTWNVGDMASGTNQTLTFVVVVNPQTTGPIVNTACATSQASDPVNTNNCASATNGTTVNAVLDITKTRITNPIVAGSNVTYTIVVHNGGLSTATNVVVTDTIPPNTTFVSGVDGSNTTVCTEGAAGHISCNLGTIDPGQSKTIFLTVHLASNASGLLSNCAVVTSPSDLGSPREDCDSNGEITTSADLWIAKAGQAPAGNPSGALVYYITVYNTSGFVADDTPTSGSGGPSDAQDVVVTDKLPLTSKSIVVQYLSPSCSYTPATNIVTCQTAKLPFGTNVTYQIQIQIKGSKGTLTNTACVTSSTPDPTAGLGCITGNNNYDKVNNVVQGSTGKPKRP
jgi:uncharacterized repeat protein (TIGR01451 family)